MKEIRKNPPIIIPRGTERKRITLRVDSLLLTQIKNGLVGQWASHNYQISSVSAFVRQALTAYQMGKLELRGNKEGGEKREISIKLDKDLLTFYQSWPPYQKSAILHKVLVSYGGELGKTK